MALAGLKIRGKDPKGGLTVAERDKEVKEDEINQSSKDEEERKQVR